MLHHFGNLANRLVRRLPNRFTGECSEYLGVSASYIDTFADIEFTRSIKCPTLLCSDRSCINMPQHNSIHYIYINMFK